MNFFLKFKKGDFLLILFLLIIPFYVNFNPSAINEKKILKIYTPFKNISLKLNKNKILKLKGERGYLILQIKNRKVRVLKSTCPNKICIKTGWISKVGESIICVPNRIIIKIEGIKKIKSKKTVDYITN